MVIPYLQCLLTTVPLTPLMTDSSTCLEEEEATGTGSQVFPICLEARSLAREVVESQVIKLLDLPTDLDHLMVPQLLDHLTKLPPPTIGRTFPLNSISTF